MAKSLYISLREIAVDLDFTASALARVAAEAELQRERLGARVAALEARWAALREWVQERLAVCDGVYREAILDVEDCVDDLERDPAPGGE